jgi:outer membrane protein assembly factor BamA
MKSETRYLGNIPDSLAKSMEFSSTVSQLGALFELDNRDNVFTPGEGMKLHIDAGRSDKAFGSDHDFWKINYYMYKYLPVTKQLTLGLRADGQQTFGDVPFYILPFLDMRGLPAARYQGQADVLAEAELRWDVVKRWSMMLYGGTGKAFDEWSDFGSAEWIFSYGTGFRYLLARKFGLRIGIDVARGPDKWAWYIVFGSSWLK